jgi:hypothetical protein
VFLPGVDGRVLPDRRLFFTVAAVTIPSTAASPGCCPTDRSRFCTAAWSEGSRGATIASKAVESTLDGVEADNCDMPDRFKPWSPAVEAVAASELSDGLGEAERGEDGRPAAGKFEYPIGEDKAGDVSTIAVCKQETS